MDKSDYKIISGLEEIPLSELHIRYIPMAKLERWYRAENGYNMMALVNSPHVEIMKIFLKYGFKLSLLMKTRYWSERIHRPEVGIKEWTKKYLIKHLKNRYKTFISLQKHGFLQEKCWDNKKKRDRSILVWKEPFWNTRFNLTNPKIKGLEIQNGAGRCAAAYVLGYKTIPGKHIEDRNPGTCKCENIEKRFK